ncbi:MAG: SRPBCC domain-containing protein [Saprospiraceae bacterium]|nr:SRPBCC domain-containing protein [Saprospiraceae bacterium]
MKNILLLLLIAFSIQNSFAQQTLKMTDKAIIKTATVDCSLDSLWRKWTTHEGLLTFFGQDNKMELRPYGPFEIYFSKDAPTGKKGSEGCTVLSFIPKRMFSFSWNAPPSIKDSRESGYHTCVVVDFKALENNNSEVIITHTAWPEGAHWDKTYEYFDAAWNKVLEWLVESCKKK